MFWHNYLPDSIILSVGPLAIHWYGLILVSAIIVSALIARRYFIKKNILTADQFEDLAFYLIIFGLIGARFGHVVFFNLSYYLQNPVDIFKVWQGGLAIQGALLFGFITAVLWSRRHKVNFWKLTDGVVLAVPLGQAIGRWGNYFNQELFGKPTDAWFSIPIDINYRIEGYETFTHFHPIFFYESILSLVLFLVLYKIAFKNKLKIGQLTLFYFIGYGLIRFLVEFVRIDYTFSLGGIRIAQIISLLFIFLVYYIYYIGNKKKVRS